MLLVNVKESKSLFNKWEANDLVINHLRRLPEAANNKLPSSENKQRRFVNRD